MLPLAFAAGLQVSELVGLRLDRVEHGPAPCVRVVGKGRRERILPLWKERHRPWECQKPGALRRELDCWVAKPSVQHRRPDLKHTMDAAGL